MANNYPLVVIVGLDPDKHKIPALLTHYISKMSKDFPISFIAEDDLNENTGNGLKMMLREQNYVPLDKDAPVPAAAPDAPPLILGANGRPLN